MFEMLENRLMMSGYTLASVATLPSSATTFPTVDSQGDLYFGTRSGEIFEIKAGATTATLLMPAGSASPDSRLMLDAQGDIYFGDGISSFYELPVGSSVPTLIQSGLADATALAIDSSGNIYGATVSSGQYADGTVFEWSPSTQTFTTIGTFNGADGSYPCSLSVDAQGDVFGIAIYGGGGTAAGTSGLLSGPGTVFEITAASDAVTPLASFNAATVGSNPSGPIAVDSSGNIFGTDSGTGSYGGIFEYKLATATLSDLYNFTGQADGTLVSASGDPSYPGVVIDSSNDVFGATVQGAEFPGGTSGGTQAFQYGTVYELPQGSSTLTEIAEPTLTGTTESGGPFEPANGIFMESNGVIISAAESVTAANLGVGAGATAIYSLTPGSSGGGSGGGGGGVTVTNTSPLLPTIDKSTLPTSVVSGSLVKGAVTLTVTNSSAAKVAGKETIALYATTDGVIDSSSTRLDSLVRSLSLKAGLSTKFAVGLKIATLPAGTYTILSQATDISGGVSTSSTGPTLSVAAANVALAGTVGSVSPVTLAAGKALAFTLTITNTGNVSSTGLADLALYLSVDGIALSVPLETPTKKLTIKPGGRALAIRLKVKVPADTAAGSFYPLVSFTQGTSTFTAAAQSAISIT